MTDTIPTHLALAAVQALLSSMERFPAISVEEAAMTYEYTCESCGHCWEAEQKITDPPLKECPQCNEPRAKRLVSGGAGFALRGEGWFKTGGY